MGTEEKQYAVWQKLIIHRSNDDENKNIVSWKDKLGHKEH